MLLALKRATEVKCFFLAPIDSTLMYEKFAETFRHVHQLIEKTNDFFQKPYANRAFEPAKARLNSVPIIGFP